MVRQFAKECFFFQKLENKAVENTFRSLSTLDSNAEKCISICFPFHFYFNENFEGFLFYFLTLLIFRTDVQGLSE